MVVMNSHISWTDTTWNPTTGCTKVSAGCDHCYAEALTNRLKGKGAFDTVELHEKRLAAVRGFLPITEAGQRRPRLVFVNSMSDLFHKDIPDSFRDKVFDAMATQPDAMFQILTKRPMTMKRYCAERFGQQKIPNNLWLGTSVEDNRVAGRIDQLVQMKELHGDFVAFLSVEPLIGPVDKHGYRFMDWILIGGESGNGARPCAKAWVEQAIEAAMQADVPIWFKQWGQWKNNPLYHQQPRSTSHLDRVARAIEAGELHASIESEDGKLVVRGEKGGATIDGMDYRDYPEWFYVCRAAMNNSDEKGRLT